MHCENDDNNTVCTCGKELGYGQLKRLMYHNLMIQKDLPTYKTNLLLKMASKSATT